MPDITKIKIGNERERSYKDFPANREFKKRAEDDNPGGGGWPADLPKPSVGGYGYTEQGEETVLFDGTVDLYSDEEESGPYYTSVSLDDSLIVGAGCDVAFGNENYHLLVREADLAGDSFIYIGNTSFIGGEDDGVPFIIANMGSEAQMVSFVGGSKNLKIIQRADLEHKIDIRYIPNIPKKPVTVHNIPLYTDYECTRKFNKYGTTMFSVGESCDIYLYGGWYRSENTLYMREDSFSEAIQEFIEDYRTKYYDTPCFIARFSVGYVEGSGVNEYEYTVTIENEQLNGNNDTIWVIKINASDDAPDSISIHNECFHPGKWIR